MNALLVLPGYVLWHYTIALKEFVHIYVNLLWFVTRFFNIERHTSTLFSPWHRIVETSANSLEDIAGNITINLMSRIVGACVRLPVILLGLLLVALLSVTAVAGIFFWLTAPIALPTMLFVGIFLLF